MLKIQIRYCFNVNVYFISVHSFSEKYVHLLLHVLLKQVRAVRDTQVLRAAHSPLYIYIDLLAQCPLYTYTVSTPIQVFRAAYSPIYTSL